VIISTSDKRIVFAGTTSEGSAHDKAITDDAALAFDSSVIILADSGLQGALCGKAMLLLPCKKPRGKERPDHHRQWNQALARVRVVVEHALANVKTFRIVKDVIRLRAGRVRDRVFEIACALANLRLKHPIKLRHSSL
jgi:hypothetical protein